MKNIQAKKHPTKHSELYSDQPKHPGNFKFHNAGGPVGGKIRPGKGSRMPSGNIQLKKAARFHRKILPTYHGQSPGAGNR